MRGIEAPPRRNGELVFTAPWEGRVFAMAIALQQRLGFPWDDFRRRLIAEIERDPQRPYYESWLAALEALTTDLPGDQSSYQHDRKLADVIFNS